MLVLQMGLLPDWGSLHNELSHMVLAAEQILTQHARLVVRVLSRCLI
jgi:hypothetical protein